jgi:hypothetical protein
LERSGGFNIPNSVEAEGLAKDFSHECIGNDFGTLTFSTVPCLL